MFPSIGILAQAAEEKAAQSIDRVAETRNRQFVHKMFVHNFCPLPPPQHQQSDELPLHLALKGPQTEWRALSQNSEQTLPQNKLNFGSKKQTKKNT